MRWRREVDPRVAELLDGAAGERLLAWGELVDGQVVVCTDLAIHMPGGRPGPVGPRGPGSVVRGVPRPRGAGRPGCCEPAVASAVRRAGAGAVGLQGTRPVDRGRLASGGTRRIPTAAPGGPCSMPAGRRQPERSDGQSCSTPPLTPVTPAGGRPRMLHWSSCGASSGCDRPGWAGPRRRAIRTAPSRFGRRRAGLVSFWRSIPHSSIGRAFGC